MSSNIDNPSVRVVKIVELVLYIDKYLCQEDRLSCVKVSKDWNHAFIHVLYRTIDDCQGAWHRILKSHDNPDINNGFDRDYIYSIFQKFGSHIRHLHTTWRVIVDAAYLGQTCTQLQSFSSFNSSIMYTHKGIAEYEDTRDKGELTYKERREPGVTGDFLSSEFVDAFYPIAAGWRTQEEQLQDWYTTQHFWLLIQQNVHLKFLKLGWCLSELFSVNPEYVYGVLRKLPQLNHLVCQLDEVELDRVLDQCPQLQSYQAFLTSGFYCFRGRVWPTLQSIKLRSYIDREELFLIFESLPGLLHLQVGGFRSMETEEVIHEPRGDGTYRLESLYISNMLWNWDKWLGTVALPYLPNLLKYFAPHLNRHTGMGLVAYCKKFRAYTQTRLQSSNYINVGTISDPGVFEYLLENCTQLKILDGVHHKINVDLLDRNPWVCSHIEELRCQFVGFSRLTAEEEARLDTVATENEDLVGSDQYVLHERFTFGRMQQQDIYTRLSAFTQLRILDFGYEYRDLLIANEIKKSPSRLSWYPTLEEPIPGTMELSLASGLGQLVTLKNLEVFGFEGVDHRIGKPELEWMATHWPKLKVIRGLQEDDIPGPKTQARKKVLREYMQMLRPDIRHEAGPRRA
ncbi:hypothetical protein FBU30_007704 [Linnemannia zychae]|nr:hypothetical protein FBU30_007704 [Linnemannia zychae]